MFGFVVANLDKLNASQRELYQAVYCGLCRELGLRHGQITRATLTYDMSFLILLLSSLADEEPHYEQFRCPIHPLKKRSCFTSRFTAYAADMNLILAHAQRLDDWEDDKNVLSLSQAKLLKHAAMKAREKYTRQVIGIDECLQTLSMMENDDVANPDLPANVFGNLLSEIFVPDEQMPKAAALHDFGFALGRFIYIMDAAVDLVDDLKKKRYNPLISIPSAQHEDILRLQMAQTAACFDRLEVQRNEEILENILYSGVWTKFSAKFHKEVSQA